MQKNYWLMLSVLMLASCSTIQEQQKLELKETQKGKVDVSSTPVVEDKVIVPIKSVQRSELSGDVLFRLLSAEIAGRRGNMVFALEQYLEVAGHLNNAEVAKRAATIAEFRQDDVAIEKTATRWLVLAPDSAGATQLLFGVSLRKNDKPNADKYAQLLLKQVKKTDDGLRLISARLLKETKTKIALPVLLGLVKKYPNNTNLLFVQAKRQYENKDYTPALVAINRVLDIDPDYIDAYVIKSGLMYEAKQKNVIPFLQDAIKKHPKSVKLRLTLIRFLIDAKQLEATKQHLEAIYAQAMHKPKVMFTISLLAIEATRIQVAKKYLKRVVYLGVYLSSSNYYLGRIATQEKQHKQAIKYYSGVLSGSHKDEAQFRIIESLVQLKQIKIAREHIAILRVNYQNQPEKRLELDLFEGELLRSIGKYQASYDVLNLAVQLNPNNIELLYSKALSAERLNKHDEFEQNLKGILKKHPQNAQALNALGYYLVSKTDRLAEAGALINKAYQLEPEDPVIIDSIGWLNYRKGDFVEAEKWLEKASLLTFDPEISAHMGEVYWLLGKKEKAMLVWKKALKAFPTDTSLTETMKRLKVEL
jgi:tetratricopeptide (TPR) repeat protein